MRQIWKLYSFSYTQLKQTVIISVLYLALGIMMQVRLEITEFRTNLFMSNAYMQTDSEGNLLQNIWLRWCVLQVLSCDWIFYQFCELKGYYFDSVLNIMKVFVLQLTHT